MLTSVGLVTYYVLFFMHLDTRRVHIAGITTYPDEAWMKQIGRNVTMADIGFLEGRRYGSSTATRSIRRRFERS